MKVAVSLPDALFERAERAAMRLGRTRSALYADALAAYLDGLGEADDVTAALDEIFSGEQAPASSGSGAGRRLIDNGSWEW